MYAKCTFNYFYCIMDHCLLFCYCILVVHIYAHIVLYLSSRIVFLVFIELTKYKLSRAAIAPPHKILHWRRGKLFYHGYTRQY